MLSDDIQRKLENITGGIIIEGEKIIAQQPEISYAQALEQVQRLSRTSKVNPLSKKSRPNS